MAVRERIGRWVTLALPEPTRTTSTRHPHARQTGPRLYIGQSTRDGSYLALPFLLASHTHSSGRSGPRLWLQEEISFRRQGSILASKHGARLVRGLGARRRRRRRLR
jgi:hypothetical protein